MKPELESICDLVRACGLFIKDIDRDHLHVDAKSGRADLVTQYDKQVQERLRKWIDEKIYPFAPDDASEARAAFDAGVAEMRAKLDGFDSLPVAERGYLFSLVRKAVR